MQPDYGMFLFNSKYNTNEMKEKIVHNFYDLPIDHFTRVDTDAISTMLVLKKNNQDYAVSFDLKWENISYLLAAIKDPMTQINFLSWIKHPDAMFTTYDFAPPLIVKSIAATIGVMQTTNGGEQFMPLIIKEIK